MPTGFSRREARNPSSTVRTRRRRLPSSVVVLVTTLLLATSTVTAIGPSLPAASSPDFEPPLSAGLGDFRLENFATGGIGNENFVYRGYAFRPARDVTVTGLWGGSGPRCKVGGFASGLWRASMISPTGASSDQPSFRLEELLGEVSFQRFEASEPEFVAFDEDIELRSDQYYVIAQGRTGNQSNQTGCHYRTTSLDIENLLIGSAIIGEWFPGVSGKYNLGESSKDPSAISVGSSGLTMTSVRTGGPLVLVGFRYRTAIVLAQFDDDAMSAVQQAGTTNVLITGQLSDTGVPAGVTEGDETTLFFEIAEDAAFTTNPQLVPASPADLTGAQTSVPFNVSISDLTSGDVRHFRPVAINEAGRANGQSSSFEVGDMALGFDVTRSIALDGGTGSVQPGIRSVVEGQSTTFLALPGPNSAAVATSENCSGLVRSGNTFTVGPVTADCSIEFVFVDSDTAPAPTAPRSTLPAPAGPSPVAEPGGGLPVTPPGVSTGSVGGVPVVPTPARPTPGTASFQVGSVQTSIDVAVAGAGSVGGTGAAPVLRATRDRVATISGGGMRPGGIAEVWMPLPNGGSRQVALLPIAADGTFDGALPFTGELDGRGPLPIGDRTIQLFGTGADGQLTVINVGVRIEQPGPLAPEPERSPGAPPTLTPGQSLATNAGVATPVTVTPQPEARSTRIEGDGWLMDVDVPDGTVRDEAGAPLIEIVNGTDSRVRGTGFMPGTRAYVWLMSDPTFLGEVTVGADGTFSGDVPIAGVAAGQHTLQLSGVGTDGYIRAANLGVVLVGDGMPRPTRVPAGEGPLQVPGAALLWALGLAGTAFLVRSRVAHGAR